MTTQHDVMDMHRRNPTWHSEKIARELGCLGGYVRAVAQRRGFTLPKGTGGPQRGTGERLIDLGRAAKAAGLTLEMLAEIAADLEADA